MAIAEHVEGQTEVWVQDILVALLKGLQRQNPTVLECGGFMGHTSMRLFSALWESGGGTLLVAEYDPDAPERAGVIDAALDNLSRTQHNVKWQVLQQDAISVINSLPDASLDFVYLDDDHTHAHVDAELNALFPKMRPGSLICGHDVIGVCDLQQEFKRYGGIALPLPYLGPAGGLGILPIE